MKPALLALGVQLLDVPLAHESILAARGVLLEHSRAAARELSALLREAVGEHESVAAVKSLSAHMQPLVVRAADHVPALPEGGAAGVAQGVLDQLRTPDPHPRASCSAIRQLSLNLSPVSAFSTSSAGGVNRSP